MSLLLCFVLACHPSWAQQGSVDAPAHQRISIITCGPGDDIWEVFGHACIRVFDSSRTDSFRDAVFNYGMFDYNHTHFFTSLVRGTLPYYLGVMPFSVFRRIFEDRRRSMFEELLVLGDADKQKLVAYLGQNSLPENREYKYDFLTNNCSSCIRDVFQRVYGTSFVLGNALPTKGPVTYRMISDQYAYRKPLERFGVYIFLGSTMDKVIDNEELMFIPDYLRKGFETATLHGQKIAQPSVQLLPGNEPEPGMLNSSMIVCGLLAAPAVIGLSSVRWRRWGRIFANVLLVLTGLAGCIILFFSLGTDHVCAQYNFNVLWAFPLNIAVPLMRSSWKPKYSLQAMLLIVAVLIIHLLRIQVIPLLELSPLLIALFWIHGYNYRQNREVSN